MSHYSYNTNSNVKYKNQNPKDGIKSEETLTSEPGVLAHVYLLVPRRRERKFQVQGQLMLYREIP